MYVRKAANYLPASMLHSNCYGDGCCHSNKTEKKRKGGLEGMHCDYCALKMSLEVQNFSFRIDNSSDIEDYLPLQDKDEKVLKPYNYTVVSELSFYKRLQNQRENKMADLYSMEGTAKFQEDSLP